MGSPIKSGISSWNHSLLKTYKNGFMLALGVYWQAGRNLNGLNECCAQWKLLSNEKIVISNLPDDALWAPEQGQVFIPIIHLLKAIEQNIGQWSCDKGRACKKKVCITQCSSWENLNRRVYTCFMPHNKPRLEWMKRLISCFLALMIISTKQMQLLVIWQRETYKKREITLNS